MIGLFLWLGGHCKLAGFLCRLCRYALGVASNANPKVHGTPRESRGPLG